MKRSLALIGLGILALGLQGGIATILPRGYCPDLGLLVVLALGLRWEGFAGGVFISAVLGFAADLLSGSLLGVHALMRMFTFGWASLARRQLNLQGPLPLGFFTAVMTFVYAFGIIGLTRFVIADVSIRWTDFGVLIPQALVNGVFAPAVAAGVGVVWDRFGDNERHRSGLQLEAPRTAR